MRAFSPAYLATLVATVVAATTLCLAGRRQHGPSRWVVVANWLLAAALLVTSGLWLATTIGGQRFSPATSLPFALCDFAALVAAAALVTRAPLLVELTYFWGLAGTLQSLLTPDLNVGWPSLQFVEYVVAHAAIVCAALFLVVGQRLAPRPRAVPRIWLITVGYSALVGAIDAITGGNYMYLRRPPGNWTLLRVLGPWPWYIASAAGVAIILFTLLDAPFWRGRAARASAQPIGLWGDGTRRQRVQRPDRPDGCTFPAGPGGARRSLAAGAVRVTSSGPDPREPR